MTAFRGDLINGFDVADRKPDPNRLIQGYFHSAATLNYANALIRTGFANIHDAAKWDLDFMANSSKRQLYHDVVNEVFDSLDFAHTCGVGSSTELKTIDLFTSHEGLTLDYEECLTRSVNGKFYNVGAHFLWIGERTRQLDHAHVEYFRGIANPIGMKVGPDAVVDEVVDVVRRLWPNPKECPGKMTLITRMGHDRVEKSLTKLIQAFQEADLPVVWVCDPCHGNTQVTSDGTKTRDVDKILAEIEKTFEVHARMGSHLGGVHFELTGENVTECIGGPEGLSEEDLSLNYTSYCDPRLNYAQSMEVAFLLTRLLGQQKQSRRIKSALLS